MQPGATEEGTPHSCGRYRFDRTQVGRQVARLLEREQVDHLALRHDLHGNILAYGGERGYVDLGATATLAATFAERMIAVEIKGFFGPSVIADLEQAVGQYLVYTSWMRRVDPDREFWLAISADTDAAVFGGLAAQAVLQDYGIRLLVVDVEQERIVAWKQ